MKDHNANRLDERRQVMFPDHPQRVDHTLLVALWVNLHPHPPLQIADKQLGIYPNDDGVGRTLRFWLSGEVLNRAPFLHQERSANSVLTDIVDIPILKLLGPFLGHDTLPALHWMPDVLGCLRPFLKTDGRQLVIVGPLFRVLA